MMTEKNGASLLDLKSEKYSPFVDMPQDTPEDAISMVDVDDVLKRLEDVSFIEPDSEERLAEAVEAEAAEETDENVDEEAELDLSAGVEKQVIRYGFISKR
ncbi:MAG: hypothetical protein WKF30_10550 [Pyrinomonadaceae bacterium]